jgi:carbon-monoxide dehydrogenase medium subunit
MVDPSSDHIASADYKRALIGELTRRAVEAACARAMENE